MALARLFGLVRIAVPAGAADIGDAVGSRATGGLGVASSSPPDLERTHNERLAEAFEHLGRDLASRGVFLELAVYGGSAIMLHFAWSLTLSSLL